MLFDRDAFATASGAALAPHKLEGTLAVMLETSHAQRVTRFAAETPARQTGYGLLALDRRFAPTRH